MQEEAKKTVDIDTSGPEVVIQLPEEKTEEVVEQRTEDKTYENERETKLEDGGIAGDSSEKPVEQSDVQASDKQEDNSKQIEEYSEGVKKRIAKLTKRMREAERQKEEALRYADSIKKERDQFKTTADSLDKNYVTEMEGRITSGLAAAQEKLRAARQAEDLTNRDHSCQPAGKTRSAKPRLPFRLRRAAFLQRARQRRNHFQIH